MEMPICQIRTIRALAKGTGRASNLMVAMIWMKATTLMIDRIENLINQILSAVKPINFIKVTVEVS